MVVELLGVVELEIPDELAVPVELLHPPGRAAAAAEARLVAGVATRNTWPFSRRYAACIELCSDSQVLTTRPSMSIKYAVFLFMGFRSV